MSSSSSSLRRLLRYARPHRARIFSASSFSVLNKAFDLAPPLLIGAAIDIIDAGGSIAVDWTGVEGITAKLWVLAAITLVVWGLESLFEYAFAVQWRNLAQTVQHDLRMDAYAHIQQLEMSHFEDRSTGQLMAVLNDDVNQLERFLDRGANDLLQVATTVILVGAAFFVIAPSVAWFAFLPVPLIVLGSFRFQTRIAPRYQSVRDQAGNLNAAIHNNISGIATIKSFAAEGAEVERIAGESDEYRRRNALAIRLSSAFSPLIRMVIVLGFTATLVYGGALAANGSLSLGSYGVMVFLTQRLLWPLTRLGETFDLYHRAMASTDRVLDVLDTEVGIVSGPRRIEDPRGHMALEGVSFRYHSDVPTLESVDLDIPAGETTAIVGSTGAGKSTVVKLLLRFYDPDEGRVTLDGVDLRELDLASLRRAIGLVSQDVYLFHGTVSDNIAYGNPRASQDEIVAAARLAEAHDFILELPAGYDTIVGERGQKLSGGQRQRISLARAIVKDPPILVLDEATSSVDNETEAAIQRSLALLSHQRTMVVIAHRLSTIRHADRIHVLDRGRIVEAGDHEELVARDGIYAALWKVQTGEAAHPAV